MYEGSILIETDLDMLLTIHVQLFIAECFPSELKKRITNDNVVIVFDDARD